MLIPCSQPVAHDCRTPECSVLLLELLLLFISEANISFDSPDNVNRLSLKDPLGLTSSFDGDGESHSKKSRFLKICYH